MDSKRGDPDTGSPSTNPPGQTALEPRTDSGWAWVVMVGAFLVNFTAIGFVQSQGVYLTVWMEDFDTSAATTGLVISVGAIMRGVLSTFSGALCTKFGSRIMMVVGGVLTVGGILMCAFAPSIEFLIISNGLIVSLGTNLAFVSAFQALGIYFKKKFAIAAGLASGGVSVGQLALPPLYTFLIDEYGWRGSMFITAAISGHIVISGAVMRPNKNRAHPVNTEQSQVAVDTMERSAAPATDQHSNNENYQECSGVQDKTSTADKEIENGISNAGNVTSFVNDKGAYDHDDSGVAVVTASAGGNFVKPTEANDLSTESINTDPTAITVSVDDSDRPSLSKSVRKPDSAFGHVVNYLSQFKNFMLDTYGLRRLAHNPRYILMLFVAAFLGAGSLCISYIVPRATSVGLDAEAASLLLSMIGAGNLLGRIGNGWFIDKKYITVELLFASALLVYSVSAFLMPVFTTFTPMICLSCVLGVAAGTCSILFFLTARSLVQPTDVTGAVGVILLIWCLGNAAGVFAAGVIYDVTQKYDSAFFTGGASLLVASLLAFCLYFPQKCKRSSNSATRITDTNSLGKTAVESQLHLADSSLDQAASELEASVHTADIMKVRHACTSTDYD